MNDVRVKNQQTSAGLEPVLAAPFLHAARTPEFNICEGDFFAAFARSCYRIQENVHEPERGLAFHQPISVQFPEDTCVHVSENDDSVQRVIHGR